MGSGRVTVEIRRDSDGDMSLDLLVNVVSGVNALLVIVSVWLLSDGRTWIGNRFVLAAAVTGLPLGVLVAAWPLAGLNVVLGTRAAWMLYRGRQRD